MSRIASIKETGEEISQADWERFDAAVAREKAERPVVKPVALSESEPSIQVGDER